MSERMRGTVKWYSEKKFGFIVAEDNSEIFFHVNDCNFAPVEGLAVEFEQGTDRSGRSKAIRIVSVGANNVAQH